MPCNDCRVFAMDTSTHSVDQMLLVGSPWFMNDSLREKNIMFEIMRISSIYYNDFLGFRSPQNLLAYDLKVPSSSCSIGKIA